MTQKLQFIFLAACMGIASGCGGMPKNWTKGMLWAEKPPQLSESKYQAPVKMVALWSPAMYTATGSKPTRGFGGRLYFYNARNEAIPVEGQLVVYGFNDTHKSQDDKQADRRYAYTPEQFSTHFSPTELGASYSIWVPWDAVGSPQAEISLLPIFTAASGQVVVGQQSLGLLPGPETPVPETSIEQTTRSIKVNDAIKPVGHEEPVPDGTNEGGTANQPGLRTLSITLPQNLAERVAAAGQRSEPALLPKAEDLSGIKARPLVPSPASLLPGSSTLRVKEPMTEKFQSGLFPPLRPLTHSEHSQPRVPGGQHPRPVAGPAPMQLPHEEQQPILP